ncbi:hypothetical protein [Hydrogenovibrio marinus]|uniref:hypothetical protein n=1 Tax=Hydrogenovibrio marinus TaxID=28885 RepID=UPI0012DE83E8|nr:hypothetical protein [Hydrogenovibrio marinus]
MSRLEGVMHEVLKLSIEAPRAKTITKCAALVDSIDLLHDMLEIGAANKLIKGGYIASIMQPKSDEHPGGELWQLAAISRSMLNKAKTKK